MNRLQHVRVSFQKQGFMRLLHARISRLEKGLVEISASNRPELSQQDRFVHAGVMATLADNAAGYATPIPSAAWLQGTCGRVQAQLHPTRSGSSYSRSRKSPKTGQDNRAMRDRGRNK